jgi:CheY-like chemotaxis protein/phosphoribosyl 1,2-cyclic phosphodiesterase
MKVRLWGTRGSIATPGPGTNQFGGNTSCVEVTTAAGERFVIDCGTGARVLGAAWMAKVSRPITATILLSHTHWDHIQGFPFFAPLFLPDSKLAVYAPQGSGHSLPNVLAGQMEFTYFPVELDQLPARLSYHELLEGTHEIAGVRIAVQYLNHPAVALGYRFEADGATVLYVCDHEPFSATLWRPDAPPGQLDSILHAGDARHARFLANADLVIHDAQYTPEEYPAKRNWGHSPFDYVVEVAAAAGVRRLVLTHHDPTHDDAFLAQVEQRARQVAEARGSALEVFCAFEGCEVELEPRPSRQPAAIVASASAPSSGLRILVVDDDPELRLLARRALDKDGHMVTEASSGEEALRSIEQQKPDLVVLDVIMPQMDGLEVLKTLRSKPVTAQLPVLILTALSDEDNIRSGFDLGATDYLAKPFSIPQLAARVRACLARASEHQTRSRLG